MLATRNFFRIKKFCSQPNLSHFELSKIHTIKLRLQTLIVIPQKSTLKSRSSYSFRCRPLKLGSYVLGTIKAKFWSRQNFDLGFRSENIKFSKSLVAYFLSISAYWRFSKFNIFTFEAIIKILPAQKFCFCPKFQGSPQKL